MSPRFVHALVLAVLSGWVGVTRLPAAPPAEADQGQTDQGQSKSKPAHSLPATRDEARVRSQLLHEMIHGALQVMHRDFYREDEGLPLPSRSLEDVFIELARTWGVEIRWLVVDAEAMNVDHLPRDDFEKQAVERLAAGESAFDAVIDGVYRHAGAVLLSSQCLKCHVPNRTTLEDRTAGLVISMPLKAK